MQNKVLIACCCVMLIGAGTTVLLDVTGHLHDPPRLGVAIVAMILAACVMWREVRKPL